MAESPVSSTEQAGNGAEPELESRAIALDSSGEANETPGSMEVDSSGQQDLHQATSIEAPEQPAAAPVSHVHLSVELADGTRLRITIEALPAGEAGEIASPVGAIRENQQITNATGPVSISIPVYVSIAHSAGVTAPPTTAPPLAALQVRLQAAWRAWPFSLSTTLFGLALLVYLGTRLSGLADFPIYFFTDEAVQTVLASDLVRGNFRDYEQVFLPTYFKNGSQYNLSTSVYLQVIPYLLFGKSVFVTRAASVSVTLLAAVCIGLILKLFFKLPYWWSGVLLLSVAPAWFLHSRTAFETVLMVSLYTGMLYFYLLYRMQSPRYLYPAVVLAALTFYSYSPAQLIVATSVILLLFSDARYHWQNRWVIVRSLGLAAVLAIPYLRFYFSQPHAFTEHLQNLSSYWIQPIPLQAKLTRFIAEYLYGLSPGYWFVPNGRDLVRHLMRGYGNLLVITLPFFALGLFRVARELRNPAHRALLVTLLVAPAGAALVQVGITRALLFIVPATLLTAIGLSAVLEWFGKTWRVSRTALSLAVFAFLALINLIMLRDALVNGPTWYSDYGLGGMQYGARQLFPAIQDYARGSPETKITVSPTWANGTDVVARFFIDDPLPFQMGSIEGYMLQHLPLDDGMLFVLTPAEYQAMINSGKFTDIRLEKTILYPDGRPGFYFLRLHYVDDIDRILAAEQVERRKLKEETVSIGGQEVGVKYSPLDMGEIQAVFDGDHSSIARTLEANPLVIELTFPETRRISGIYLHFGSTEARVTARLYAEAGAEPQEYSARLEGSIEIPDGTIEFGRPVAARVVRIEVQDTRQPEPGHVHLWEIEFR